MKAAFLLAFVAGFGPAAEPPEPRAGARGQQEPEEAPRRSLAAVLREWREAVELDLPGEVLGDAARLTGPGGPLADNGEALALHARALFLAGREDEAVALLEGAQPSEGTRVFVELELARCRLERDDLQGVIELLRATRQADSGEAPVRHATRPESWLYLGRTYARAGQPRQADALLGRFVQLAPLHPGVPSAYHVLAQNALARRDLEAAQELRALGAESGRWQAYYRVRRLQVRENPDEPLPRLGLAQLWLAAREVHRARDVLVELTQRNPDFCKGWTLLADVRRQLGDLPRAEAAADRAGDCDPADPEARLVRALVRIAAGRAPEAREDLEHVVAGEHAEDRRFLRAHLELARLLLAAGEETAARERYAKYEELGGEEPLVP